MLQGVLLPGQVGGTERIPVLLGVGSESIDIGGGQFHDVRLLCSAEDCRVRGHVVRFSFNRDYLIHHVGEHDGTGLDCVLRPISSICVSH